jgi:hypothetical protein
MAALTERKVAEGVVQGREELSLLTEQEFNRLKSQIVISS